MPTPLTMAERIRRWRECSGYSRREVARKIAISRPALAQWELGNTEPTHDNLRKFCSAIGISLEDFWGKTISAYAPLKAKA